MKMVGDVIDLVTWSVNFTGHRSIFEWVNDKNDVTIQLNCQGGLLVKVSASYHI